MSPAVLLFELPEKKYTYMWITCCCIVQVSQVKSKCLSQNRHPEKLQSQLTVTFPVLDDEEIRCPCSFTDPKIVMGSVTKRQCFTLSRSFFRAVIMSVCVWRINLNITPPKIE